MQGHDTPSPPGPLSPLAARRPSAGIERPISKSATGADASEILDSRRVELVWPGADQPDAAQMARRHILLCKPGQIVARLVVPKNAEPPAPDAVPFASLRLGKGVTCDEAHGQYIAQKSGYVRSKNSLLQIEETLDLSEDLDPALGPVTFDGDVILRRGVCDLVSIKCTRDLTVHGCVEAATIQAGRNVLVLHGICGKEKGVVHAGGTLTARFLSNARVLADGNVMIEKVSDNSHIQCAELRLDHGTILSGHAIARIGIHCQIAGSHSGVKTILELGIPPAQLAEIQRLTAAIVTFQQHAREIRNVVEPLMARQKSLTAAQKEKATELLFGADELDLKVAELTRHLETHTQSLAGAMRGAIHVASMLFPGVIIRFPRVQALVATALRGPLTVTMGNVDGRAVVICTDDHGGTKTVLHSIEHGGTPPEI